MIAATSPRSASLIAISLAISGLAVGARAQASASPDAKGTPDFARDIRPILSNNCFACHGPDPKTRKRGLRLDTKAGASAPLRSGGRAIVPGDLARSEVARRISSSDPALRMPPPETGKTLTKAEIDALRAWIASGATWRAHWSFVPPTRPEVPQLKQANTTPIDAFLQRRLDREGLAAMPPASRSAWLRRVSLDLTGLPPTPAELDAFEKDDQPGAHDRVVERLFASPHYGEHMARYWLDAARYGDTHGYHLDNYRSMWPYRDWVIRAFQANMPFDRFMTEQLAGDLLPNASNAQIVASGFNRCNVTTAEGGLIAEEYLATYAMDRVETTATVFLGLTARCASCHDHKYDPLTQKDFYRLFAFFNSIEEQASDRNQAIAPPFTSVPSEEQQRRRTELRAKAARIAEAMDASDPEIDRAEARWEEGTRARTRMLWRPLDVLVARATGGTELKANNDGILTASGALPADDEYSVDFATPHEPVRSLRLEALPTKAGRIGRDTHGNIVLSRFVVEQVAANGTSTSVALRAASAEYSQPSYDVVGALDANEERGWAISAKKHALAASFELAKPIDSSTGPRLRVRMSFASRHKKHQIGRFRIRWSGADASLPAKLSPWRARAFVPAKSYAQAWSERSDLDAAAATGPNGAPARWRERKNFVDGRVHMLKGAVGTSFLARDIEVASARTLVVGLGSDDGIKAWLDDDLVHEARAPRAVRLDQDRVVLRLRPGKNRFLLAIVNSGGGHGFAFRVQEEFDTPTRITRILEIERAERSEAQGGAVRSFYRRLHSPKWRRLEGEGEAIRAELAALETAIPRTMVMRERAKPRPAHVLIRGRYDRKGEEVMPGTPSALPPLTHEGERATRLDLARWLAAPEHPLFARVTVNRFWQQVFGSGLVRTSEDFGAQGEWPSHPELLDWLATEFVRNSYDVQKLLRTLVTSDAYRRSAKATPALLAKDPKNRLLARGPRHRLDAEALRDSALAISGLLTRKIGGPSVKPYQPQGIWRSVGYTSSNTSKFVADTGDKLYRRSLYTFWKRTAAPPSMKIFDAPSREACRVRRERTNTPLQALTLLNDVQFVEAARAFAERMIAEGGAKSEARIAWGFRVATSRRPEAAELAPLCALLRAEEARFRRAPKEAVELVNVGRSKARARDERSRVEAAAYTVVASVLLNLDETLNK